ncbi:MAG TPA: DUF4410 domain-containing protein [Verrucomicrobiae bacterium]|nr:DUF4410 domain-containing protein [Verrucomicrobiae bacterium]
MMRMKQLSIAVFVFTALALSAGCGVGRNMVLQSPQTRIRAASATVAESNSTVSVPAEVKSDFQSRLDKYLYGEGGFQRGQELRVRYRFIQYEPGSQFGRWFMGGLGNMGEGSLTIETKFYDSADKELATIQTEGRIGSGFFGGSYGEALDKAAEKIAEFARTNFR